MVAIAVSAVTLYFEPVYIFRSSQPLSFFFTWKKNSFTHQPPRRFDSLDVTSDTLICCCFLSRNILIALLPSYHSTHTHTYTHIVTQTPFELTLIKEYSYRKVNLHSVELKDIDLRLFLCEATLLFFPKLSPFCFFYSPSMSPLVGLLETTLFIGRKKERKKKDGACGTSPEFCGTFFFSFLFKKKLNCVFLAIKKHTGTEGNNIRRENTTTAFFLSLFCFKSEFISDREQLWRSHPAEMSRYIIKA